MSYNYKDLNYIREVLAYYEKICATQILKSVMMTRRKNYKMTFSMSGD